jgi:uncharacterized protein YecE (DUF72 family)
MATKQARARKILVGTASWTDPGFVERWYPPKLPAGDRLSWYAEHFDMVEVNSSFYALPDARLVRRWCEATPDGFIFNVKVHRLLSRHAAALKSLPSSLQRVAKAKANGQVTLTPEIEEELLEELLRASEPLRAAKKFGAFLLQLSPAFSPRKSNLSELEPLIARLAPIGLAVELRNRNWVEYDNLESALEFFRRHQVALALVDAPNEKHFTIMPSELDTITNPRLAYWRLHGRNAHGYLRGKSVAERFHYDYNDEEIDELAKRAKKLARDADSVHVIFNNNALDFAPHAAARMRAALGQLARARLQQTDLFR